MKIYTKTGDKGQTSLIGGRRIPKSHLRLDAYGTIDELNAFTGLLSDTIDDLHDKEILLSIQSSLFSVGCVLASDPDAPQKSNISCPDNRDIVLLEKEIDRMDSILPPLKNFILPGGCPAASLAHVCRTIARRAERCIYRMEDLSIDTNVLIFMNRLSDYFFVLARKECKSQGVDEKIWNNPCK